MPIHDFFNIYNTYMYMYHVINNIFHVLIFSTLKMVTIFDAGAYCHFFEFKGRSDSTDCHH